MSGLGKARNSVDPDGVIAALMTGTNADFAVHPSMLGFWIVKQLRDIPVCYDIPIAVVSTWTKANVHEEVKKHSLDMPPCYYFQLSETEAIVRYINKGDPSHQRSAN